MILKLEGFQYAMHLDLNTRYYHIRLTENTSNLCTIFLPWRKYCYKRLPMVIADYPDIFQQNIIDLFHVFEFIRACIDNFLILTKVYWKNHVYKLEYFSEKPKWNI